MATTLSPERIYKIHSKNHGRIQSALERIELLGRRALASEDPHTINAIIPLYSLLIAACAEAHLLKILFEPHAFTLYQRNLVLGQSSHIGRWNSLLDTSFRKHCGLNPKTQLDKTSLPIRDFHIYYELKCLLADELCGLIEMRNKLAHGQWEYPLNDDWITVNSAKMRILNNENLLSLKFKRSIILNLLTMIRDLAVSHKTLHRDFQVYYGRLKNARINLIRRSYEKYEKSLIEKAKRGARMRENNRSVVK